MTVRLLSQDAQRASHGTFNNAVSSLYDAAISKTNLFYIKAKSFLSFCPYNNE